MRVIRSLPELLEAARHRPAVPVMACAAAHDESVLSGVYEATRLGLVHPLLIGDRERIRPMCERLGWPVPAGEIVHEPDAAEAARVGVALCERGDAQVLMKGAVPTSTVLKAALASPTLRTGSVFTHATAFRPRGSRRLVLLADAGVNIAPGVEEKISIVRDMTALARALGMPSPRVALLAAAETVNPKMPSSVEADAVVRHFAALDGTAARERPRVGGPYALDIALSPEAAAQKGIADEIAGHADVLVAPDIDAGNVLYKALTVLAGLDLGSIVLGARVPMVVPSRADTSRTRVYSIALALVAARAGAA